jgi:hypothetical protein
MHATTVKLDSALVKIAKAIKPDDVTLTAFIRSLVEREARQQKQYAAALEYEAFLAENSDEAEEMSAWENASLSRAPKARRSIAKAPAKKKK